MLELRPSADLNSIRNAYRRLVLICHPDKNRAPDAEARFKQIQSAYECLRDPIKKADYDAAAAAAAAAAKGTGAGRRAGSDAPGHSQSSAASHDAKAARQSEQDARKQKRAEEQERRAAEQAERQARQEDECVGAGDDIDTYADYEPSKVRIGRRHPDSVVETSSMSAVQPPDARLNFKMGLPKDLIMGGLLSGLQLESVVYASMRHSMKLPNGQRAGFLLGDGPGVGKGRQIAGLVYENYRKGRKKAVWFSAAADLASDAERDLRDIGASKLPLYSLPSLTYPKVLEFDKGVLFCTYTCLISSRVMKDGVRASRIDQLVEWCGGKEFDGVVVFDECHKAKNLTEAASSQTAKHVLAVQQRMPDARVIYVSATGASELHQMAYMDRLGLWGPGTAFQNSAAFACQVSTRGVGAMEVVAMDMQGPGLTVFDHKKGFAS